MKKTFNIKDLQRSGLFNTKENGDGNLIFYSHRIIIPYMWNWSIIYLRGRYFFEKFSKVPEDSKSGKYLGLKNDQLNLNSPRRFYNSDFFLTGISGEKLYLVEGEMDVIALESLRRNAIGIPGVGNMPDEKQMAKLLKYDIVIIGDDDEAGKTLISKLSNYFREHKKQIKLKKLPTKDVNDFIIKYSD
jgi:DNA primase